MGLHDYSRASTAIEAVHADEVDTADLRLSPGAIVLVARAVNVAPDDSPVQYSQTRFAADRITLFVETHRIQKSQSDTSITAPDVISSAAARSNAKRTSKN
jgi:hypothetical protein